MSKTRRKSDTCLNCKFALRPEDNYCPNCGQENNIHKIPVHHLAIELFEDLFHFDTKLWNTIKASFTRPGKITLDYLDGKRASYIPPVKFYVFVSFIFFLLVGKQGELSIDSGNKTSIRIHGNVTSISINKLIGKKNSDLIKDSNEVNMLRFDYTSKETLKNQLRKLKTASNSALNDLLIEKNIDTTLENRTNLRTSLSLIPDNFITLDTFKPRYNVYGKVSFSTKEEYENFKDNISSYSNKQVDSVILSKGEKVSWYSRQMVKKMSKFEARNNDYLKEVIHAIIKSISLTMFIMMPLTAILLLFIFYRKKYYYEHLIFSIHIHTIFFIIFSLVLTIQIFISQKLGGGIWFWAFLLCLVYLIASLKNNYKQSWGKTILKFILMSIPYLIISSILIILAVFYGFLA